MSNELLVRKKRAEILAIEASREQIEVRILERMLEIDGMRQAIKDQEKKLAELKTELISMEGN